MHLVKLNLARNCLKYLIKLYGINEIFIPFYTCPTVWNAVRQTGCRVEFYHIDTNFLPVQHFPKDAFILYTNYFGLNTENCKNLAKIYPNLIVDNSHSFFSESVGLASFNSLRKFFDVTNGAYLFVEKLLENDFEQDNLYLPSVKFNQNYPEFLNNELLLNQEISIKTLSENVQNKMKNIDFCFEKERRIHLFKQYEKIFQADNEIFLMLSDGEVPYCYPFCTSKTIYNKIFNENGIILLKLWKNYPKNFEEYYLNNTAVIPLDDDDLAKKIISVLG